MTTLKTLEKDVTLYTKESIKAQLLQLSEQFLVEGDSPDLDRMGFYTDIEMTVLELPIDNLHYPHFSGLLVLGYNEQEKVCVGARQGVPDDVYRELIRVDLEDRLNLLKTEAAAATASAVLKCCALNGFYTHEISRHCYPQSSGLLKLILQKRVSWLTSKMIDVSGLSSMPQKEEIRKINSILSWLESYGNSFSFHLERRVIHLKNYLNDSKLFLSFTTLFNEHKPALMNWSISQDIMANPGSHTLTHSIIESYEDLDYLLRCIKARSSKINRFYDSIEIDLDTIRRFVYEKSLGEYHPDDEDASVGIYHMMNTYLLKVPNE